MKRTFIALLCVLLACSFAGCAAGNEEDGKIQVVATLFPQYDFARAIAGDYATVDLLLDFGTDAHSYDPTPADLMQIAKADLFIYTGGAMELWAEKLLASADIARAIESGSLKVLDLSEAVSLVCFDEHKEGDHAHGEYDPHIWTSLRNAKDMANAVMHSLIELDPEHMNEYKANTAAYTAELVMLEQALKEVVRKTTLDTCYFGGSFAFAYLFRDAGLSHMSVFEGCASHAEASAAAIAAVANAVKESGARYVLYDSPSEEKTAKAIASETGTELLRLHAIHNISKQEFKAGADYISLMRENIEVLRKALG